MEVGMKESLVFDNIHYIDIRNKPLAQFAALMDTENDLSIVRIHKIIVGRNYWMYPRFILVMGSASEGRRYILTSSLFGWAHSQNNSFYRLQSPPYIVQDGTYWQKYTFHIPCGLKP